MTTFNSSKILVLFLLMISLEFSASAQIENSKRTILNAREGVGNTGYSLSTGLTKKKNNFTLGTTKLKDSFDLGLNKKPFDMTGDNGLLAPETKDYTPKAFREDEIKDEYKVDQYFGDFKSNGKFVHLLYRDHGEVDGDMVRIFINEDIIRSSIYLGGSFKGFKINLIKGFNQIDIQALNQGSSGPNTAEFQLYDDSGRLLTSNVWNLLTGVKATVIVVKE